MKNLSWFGKFIFFMNSVFAAVLLFSYLLPFIPPKTFALLSVLSLGVPLLIIVNFLFLIYWLIALKRQMILSLVVLLLGFNHVTSIYEFTPELDDEESIKEDLSVLSYNAKQFNQFKWDKEQNIPEKINAFLKKENPDIIGIQEYFKGELALAATFPHKYINLKTESAEFGLAILSKYPIIKSGSLDFPTKSNNNGVFADVVIKKDTLRIINVHLQSFSLKPDLNNIEKEQSKKVFLGMGSTFVKQQDQMEMIMELMEQSPYKIILLGDFNNTAYSYIYRELTSAGLNDAFKEEGNGFGRTFDFDYFPLRIDYIMVDQTLDITSFETKEVFYSDHFPIKATIQLK